MLRGSADVKTLNIQRHWDVKVHVALIIPRHWDIKLNEKKIVDAAASAASTPAFAACT